jgi:hypothetical protein
MWKGSLFQIVRLKYSVEDSMEHFWNKHGRHLNRSAIWNMLYIIVFIYVNILIYSIVNIPTPLKFQICLSTKITQTFVNEGEPW